MVCTEPIDAERSATVLKADADALRRDGGETQQALVTDGCSCLAGLYGQPHSTLSLAFCALRLLFKIFDGELFHALSQRNVLAEHQSVHLLSTGKADVQRGCRHAIGRCPVCIELPIGEVFRRESLASRFAGGHFCLQKQVVLQFVHHLFVEIDGMCRVNGMYQAFLVHREVQQECAIMAYGAIVKVDQMGDTLHLFVLALVVEPPRTNRRVAL